MKSLLLLTLFYGISISTFSQHNMHRMKQLKVVVFHGSSEKSKGYMVSVNDSMFRLVREAAGVNHWVSNAHYTNFHYGEVNKIIVTRRGAALKGALLGAIIGGSAGFISGYMSGDDPPCVASNQDVMGIGYALCGAFRSTASEKASIGGSLGAVGGAVIGVCIGAVVQKKFTTARKKSRYRAMQLSMLERLYIRKK
jgi:hypothetical protein